MVINITINDKYVAISSYISYDVHINA